MRNMIEIEVEAVVRRHPPICGGDVEVTPTERYVGAILSLSGGYFKSVWHKREDGAYTVNPDDCIPYGDILWTEPFFITPATLRWMIGKLTDTLEILDGMDKDASKAAITWALEEAKKPFAEAFERVGASAIQPGTDSEKPEESS